MTPDSTRTTLFEVSWEVCNKVGGIYSVVSSKALQAVDQFGEDFYLLGPDLKTNAHFEETDESCWDSIRPMLASRDLKCRLGRWNIPGRPKVILVDFSKRYNSNQLLYDLWSTYGVDSLSGGWDYIEPLMFSTACGEVIAAIYDATIKPTGGRAVAQFHEWMCGAGLLTVKKMAPGIGTVFTTHATMLGRALAGSGMDIYKQMRQLNPQSEAAAHNITAKCSMESTSAREADCFTTVSQITADEASAFLGRTPDVITTNGLDMRVIPDFAEDRETPKKLRGKLLKAVNHFLEEDLPDNTRIFVISGRYEHHNKGVDVFLEALNGVAEALRKSDTRVLALCLVMGGHTGLNPAALSGEVKENGLPFISPFQVWNQPQDPIITTCRRLGLNNQPGDNVQVVFVPAMLDGHDGFLNMTYYDILAGCDLGVFPSWYEPWGYTPHESAAFAVPTVTTDLSGFGIWVRELQDQNSDQGGVAVIARRLASYGETVDALRKQLLEYASCPKDVLDARRKDVRALACHTSWEKFFPHYISAYSLALAKSDKRDTFRERQRRLEDLSRVLTPTSSTIPYLRHLTAIAELPPELARLRELSHNMWWCSNIQARALFMALGPQAWETTDHNPIRMIEEVDPQRLTAMARNADYMALYKQVMEKFDAYMAVPQQDVSAALRVDRPVAYFSTEYGLHESLPIYSGGLGVLSGDHLKASSSLSLPLVAVGLLYKNGYFRQRLDSEGRQIAMYPENNFAYLPVERATDEITGEPIEVEMDLPGRTLYANVWRVHVGRVSLYLMDTDTPKNTDHDRAITARLYEADRDVRLRQEILLGMGGVRMLRRLGIMPSVYHMNEGHSAFMVVERIRAYMHEQGLTFHEAFERVRSNTVFTTHTPVDAGNERFSNDLMERYFTSYAQSMGLSWPDFQRLGRMEGPDRGGHFEMTVLALRSSCRANGVSRLHGVVSQHMWRDLWKGVPIPEIPIGYVTNGVHTGSYVGQPMNALLEQYLGADWQDADPEDSIWQKVRTIPDEEYWSARMQQKEALLDALRDQVPAFMRKYGIQPGLRKKIQDNIRPDALIIGFARRFAPYKRATLLFADPDRLARLLSQVGRPVVIVFAGKSHPADQAGIELIQQVIRYAQDERFLGRIFFIEDYSLAVSRVLSQGCDVWLNTPRRPHEASGTSGEKVPVNGGINLSISDGWWCEGYNRENGWTIGPVIENELPSSDQNDYTDAEALYTLLEDSVVPLYFEYGGDGLPHRWITTSKNSMQSLTAMYSCHRMIKDYIRGYYAPAAQRNVATHSNNRAVARHLAAWKQNIPVRFGTLSIREITVTGVSGDTICCGQPLNVRVVVDPGQMQKDEILAQLVLGPVNSNGDFTVKPDVLRLNSKAGADGTRVYEGTYMTTGNGRFAYGIRIMPITAGLDSPLDSGIVLWG